MVGTGVDLFDGRDEVTARDVELRRERATVLVERSLLGDGRAPERAADGDAYERARPAPELALDDRLVVHVRDVSGACARPRCRAR